MSKEAVIDSVTVQDGAVVVDAYATDRSFTKYEHIPLLNSFDGLITVPKEGQKVIISETDNGVSYVEGVLTTVGSDAPQLAQEEFVLQFDPNTRLLVEKDGSGGFDMTIEASGDVTIGDSANAVQLAVQSHTHDYVGGGDNSSGLTSGTPNESGTSTTVE